MIISLFAYEISTKKRVFRSTQPMSSSQMNYYFTEFVNSETSSEGIIEKESYKYVYLSNNFHVFVIQVTKDYSVKLATNLLKHIEKNSMEDLFDILISIDNTLFDGEGLILDLQAIKIMDSQEEKIYNIMLENKKKEMIKRDREVGVSTVIEQAKEKKETMAENKPKKIEKSSQPVLIVIKEKIKLEIDKENYIKENILNGEINLVITDPKYRHVSIKMRNLSSNLKFSPYLNKDALRKQILRFEKDRGLNKNIPLLKWNGKSANLPIKFEFWNDEEGEKNINIIEITALKDLKKFEIKFNKEDITDIEIGSNDYEMGDDEIIWNAGDLMKGDVKTFEIKGISYNKDAIFPLCLDFISESVDTLIDVEKILVEDEEVHDFEVRKIAEVDDFKILAE